MKSEGPWRQDAGKSNSDKIFHESEQFIPGGVNSPVRAFTAVGGTPFVVARGEGAYIFDVDGRRYVDYVMSWGPLILGHAHESVVKAVNQQAGRGLTFGAPTEAELTLASLINERMPWIEKMRFVNSGTEACMTAIRLARAATGRETIVKFDGCYHGHSDSFLVRAGSGLATGGMPSSEGVLEEVSQYTLSVPYNDISAIQNCFEKHPAGIAAVIVEPVAANMGVVPPQPGFLETLRQLTEKRQSLLIFDEVVTGFRITPDGAAGFYGIKPDLVCLGKIVGGGLPVGVIGGRKEILDLLAPVGPVYQAGTLSGNPLTTAAGVATLRQLADVNVYKQLSQYADDLTGGIIELAAQYALPLEVNVVESLFSLFFASHKITDFETARRSDVGLYRKLFHNVLANNIYIPPSGFEAWFVSSAHRADHLEATLAAFEIFLQAVSS